MKGFEKVVKYVVLSENHPKQPRPDGCDSAEARQLGSINRRQRFVEGAGGLMSP